VFAPSPSPRGTQSSHSATSMSRVQGVRIASGPPARSARLRPEPARGTPAHRSPRQTRSARTAPRFPGSDRGCRQGGGHLGEFPERPQDVGAAGEDGGPEGAHGDVGADQPVTKKIGTGAETRGLVGGQAPIFQPRRGVSVEAEQRERHACRLQRPRRAAQGFRRRRTQRSDGRCRRRLRWGARAPRSRSPCRAARSPRRRSSLPILTPSPCGRAAQCRYAG
jgi:hypothetical protein